MFPDHLAAVVLEKCLHREASFYETAAPRPASPATCEGRGISRLFFVGIATDFCVAYSAIDGAREGVESAVIEYACRGIDLNGSLAAAWEQMASAKVARVSSQDL